MSCTADSHLFLCSLLRYNGLFFEVSAKTGQGMVEMFRCSALYRSALTALVAAALSHDQALDNQAFALADGGQWRSAYRAVGCSCSYSYCTFGMALRHSMTSAQLDARSTKLARHIFFVE